MPQHLQMTRITVKGFATREAVPCKLPSVIGYTISSSGKPGTAWMPFNASDFLGGIIKRLPNAGHGSKKHPYLLH